jgi:excisionase family DNA binding protein
MMKKEIAMEPRLMTAKQLAAYLSFPLSTIYVMVEQKQIPFRRFGKKIIRFDKREIDKWVDIHYDKSYHVS